MCVIEGISVNREMSEFHTKRDEDNNKLARALLRSGIYTILFFFLPNAMPPITSAIIGWPKDIIWNFPFSVVYASSF